MSKCGRCNGRGWYMGAVSQTARKKVRCSVCLGLGSYETNPAFKTKPPSHDVAVLHSSVSMDDAIALLPEGESDDGED